MSGMEASDETLRIVYVQACQSYHGVADFRGKLLALLPLASGAGIFLLLEDGAPNLLGSIGLFGAVVTVGLLIYELRGMQRCHRLEKQAEALERKLKLNVEEGGVLHLPRRGWRDMLGPPAASLVIYLAVVFAWIYLAGERWWGPDRSYAAGKGLGLSLAYVIALVVSWRIVRSWLRKTTGLS